MRRTDPPANAGGTDSLSCMVARRLFPAYLHLIETVSNNAKNPDS